MDARATCAAARSGERRGWRQLQRGEQYVDARATRWHYAPHSLVHWHANAARGAFRRRSAGSDKWLELTRHTNAGPDAAGPQARTREYVTGAIINNRTRKLI